MFRVVMRSRWNSKFAWVGAAAVCFVLTATAIPVAAKSPVKVVVGGPQGDEAAAPKAPKVPKARFSGKIESCVESTMYDTRQVGLYASMRPYPKTAKMQMRFRLLRMYFNNASYKPIEGLGLDEWITVSPKAAAAIRHIVVSGIDTDAVYMGRVDFRWRNKTGRWRVKRTVYTKDRCNQTIAAPDLQVTDLRIASTVGPVSTYEFTVANNGASEARSVEIHLLVDNKVVAARSISSMVAGVTLGYQVSAAKCSSSVAVQLDRSRLVHESNEFNNSASLACP